MPTTELDFNTIYGTLFSLSTSIEYLCCIQGLAAEHSDNYLLNKSKQAETACNQVYRQLEREVTKGMNPEQKEIALAAVDYHKDIVYQFFLMDSKDQIRVKNLMEKIRKERV